MSKSKKPLVIGLICATIAGATVYAILGELRPMPPGSPILLRFERNTSSTKLFDRLAELGIVRSATFANWYVAMRGRKTSIHEGTYRFAAGMSVDDILSAKPVSQMVRIPETNLSYRNAKLLSSKNVCDESEYNALVHQPAEFSGLVKATGNLEGYLYPDTYDLPPLFGARNVIRKQLEAFATKVRPLLKGHDERKLLTVASMIELEAALDKDRPLIAGVINNRLAKGMPLQIDATLNYAIGEWRPLTLADYKNIDSLYSTYKHKGLPPGPICSPSMKSILASLNPATHQFLYYVALPNKSHLFAKTYKEHLANISKRNAARRLGNG